MSELCFEMTTYYWLGKGHQLISSDVIDLMGQLIDLRGQPIDLMGQLIDLIYYCQFRQLGCYDRNASPTDSSATWWFSSAMTTLLDTFKYFSSSTEMLLF